MREKEGSGAGVITTPVSAVISESVILKRIEKVGKIVVGVWVWYGINIEERLDFVAIWAMRRMIQLDLCIHSIATMIWAMQ